MKKILYLHQYFAVPSSPSNTRSYDFCLEYIKRGYEVEVITADASIKQLFSNEERGWKSTTYDGIKINALTSGYSNSQSFIRRKIEFLRFAIRSTFKALGTDCNFVIATSTPLTIAIPTIIYTFLRRKPYIFEVRDVWPELPIAVGALKSRSSIFFFKFLEKLVYKRAVSIVALSVDMKSSIIRRIPNLKVSVNVIPNIAHLDRFEDSYQNTERPIDLIYVGAFGLINDVGYVLKLAEAIRDAGYPITIKLYGKGAEYKEIEQQSKIRKLSGKYITMGGKVRKEQVSGLLSEAKVGLVLFQPLPEMAANSANKFFDYLAAGIPPVINYGGWQKEFLEKNKIGLCLPEGRSTEDFKKAAKMCFELLKDSGRLKAEGVVCRELARKNFSLEVATERYIEIVNHLQDSKR